MKRFSFAILFGVVLGLLFLPGIFRSGGDAAAAAPALICLDPGHGANTGAYNPAYNLWEDEINLDVSGRLKALLEANGYQVVLTRTDNTYLTNRQRYNFCNDAAADLLVSVHTNSSTNPDVDGTMTLYFQPDDQVLAGAIHEVMYLALGDSVDWTFTDFGLEKFASGVLMKSDMPATMLEPVLMSYDPEAQLLLDPGPDSRRQDIAQAAFEGILNYYENYAGGGDDGGGGGGTCPPKSNKPGC